jgi:hypothetical protein
MKFVKNSNFPSGTIGLATGLLPRYWEFTDALDSLEVPEGTILYRRSSCDIAKNLNDCIHSMRGEWIFLLDDDHSFRPDILMRLLAHAYQPNGHAVDIVLPITTTKMIPLHPLIFHGPWNPSYGPLDSRSLMACYEWREVSAPGLFALPKGDVAGKSGMLIKKFVLDELGYPWFKCGQGDPGILHEDFTLCKELQERGHTIWVDGDIVLDHIHYCVFRAKRDAHGEYHPAIRSGGCELNLHQGYFTIDAPGLGGQKPEALG